MKRFFFASSVVLMFSSVFLSSCKKDGYVPDIVSGEIKVGSKWVYKITDFNESGAVVGTQNITLTMAAKQTINGQEWFTLHDGTSFEFIRKAADGWHQDINGSDQLLYKIPAALNDTWRVTWSASVGDYEDFTVKALNQSITVPAGILTCFYLEGFDSNSLEGKVWYNEQYVLVKSEEYDQNGAGALYKDYQWELVSFQP